MFPSHVQCGFLGDSNMDISILIKTFLRPKCLNNLLQSISKFYHLPIIVVDDSGGNTGTEKKDNVLYVYAPFDIGLSAGRNLGLKYVETEYFVLCEDDLVFNENTKLEYLLESINKGFDIVAGKIILNGEHHSYEGIFNLEGERLYLINQSNCMIDGIPVYDIVQNFFIAKTDKIRGCSWDESLKLGEHLPFFWKYKDKLVVGYDERVVIDHVQYKGTEYLQFRDRAKAYLSEWFIGDTNIKELVNFKGQLCKISNYLK